jgi:hypothetical protein
MNLQELLNEIDSIIEGIETDRYTIERLEALKTKITKGAAADFSDLA